MALRVWLPLNGNLNNQGLSNVQITNTGATINNNGKIGKAYEFGASHWLKLEKYAAEFLTYKEFSLSVWFKCTAQNTSHGGSALISSGNWNAPANLLNLALGEWKTDHYSRLLVSGSGTWSAGYDYNFNLNTWYHVTLTSGDGKMRAYVNGNLIGDSYNAFTPGSLEQDWVCIGNGTYYSGFIFNGLMNDVRIYDECLSPREIKEISKGLVAHYKLDGPQANENFLLQSDKITYGSPSTNITRTLLDDGSLKVVAVANNGNYCAIGFAVSSASNVLEKLAVGDTYTISCDVKVEEGTKYPTLFINNGNGYQRLGGPSIKLNTWQRIYYTRTWNEPGTGYGGFSLHLGFGDAIGTYYFKNFKLEKGTLTPWIPAPTDTLYTALGYANNICTDVSGNGYNLTQNGMVTFNTDTIRYSGSSLFDGDTSCFTIPFNAMCPENIFTINVWFKKDSVGTKNYETLIGGPSGFEMDTRNAGANTLSLYMATTRGGSMGNLTMGEWNMVTMVRDGVNEYYYINGELSNTIEAKSMPTGTYYIGAWQTATKQNYYGLMSDFRIYATALSANDILTIYKNSGIIDNKNNVYTYEFKEE